MEYEVHRRDGRATPAALREVLDDAVRQLAVSSDELWERLAGANSTLGRLSREDFPAGADRQLLDSIRSRMMRLDLAAYDALEVSDQVIEVSNGALEAIAEDVVRLRNRALLRAFVEPPVAS